jgi:hypothetical protein
MEAFLRVVDAGSFSAAAKQLRVGQSLRNVASRHRRSRPRQVNGGAIIYRTQEYGYRRTLSRLAPRVVVTALALIGTA